MNNVVDFKTTYIAAKKLLKISPDTETAVKFSDVTNVYFGTSTDLNICDPTTFQYKVKGDIPDLQT